MDWAIFAIDDPLSRLPNFIYNRNDPPQTLDSACSKSNMTAGEVIVAAGHGDLQAGILNQCSASLWYRDSFMTVRQVTLKKALGESTNLLSKLHDADSLPEPGDSGSWVTRDSHVCGHIVAAKKSVPWACMLPMYAILDDIKAQLGASEVGILGSRSIGKKDAAGPSPPKVANWILGAQLARRVKNEAGVSDTTYEHTSIFDRCIDDHNSEESVEWQDHNVVKAERRK